MDPKTGATTLSEISREILAYLLEHPEAHDTLEGIVEWWLLERKIKFSAEQVHGALTQLIAQGLVRGRKGGDTRTHYDVNPQRMEDIRLLLKQNTS